ncbi:MAG: type II toxin-antitoxin system RelE/ParE family toxin [Gammaproteobacteria bacterium]
MNVAFLPAAERELREAARYYEARAPGLGSELIVELERICSVIAERNEIGPRLDAKHRKVALRRFPFALIYRVDLDALLIVALAHKRRKPGYWRSRK